MDEQTFSVVSLNFHQAAVGAVPWEKALELLAISTGSQHAEIIGFGSRRFHLQSGLPDGALEDFAAAQGQDPAVNSRTRTGLLAPEMSVLDEADFTTEADCRKYPEYGAVIDRLDIPYVCLSPLQKGAESQLGLAVMRSRRVGNIERDQKRMFAATAPHVLSAINTSLALEGRAVSLVRQALEGMDEAAFVLDRSGRAKIWTSAADALLSTGVLRVKGGRLCLARGDDAGLQTSIAAAVSLGRDDRTAPRPVLAYDEHGLGFLIHFTSLQGLHGLDFDAAALLIAKTARPLDGGKAEMARQLFGLTLSEAAVAGLLASGHSAQVVAERQGVAVGTVRTHIRRILEKSGTGSQLEFLSELSRRF